MPGQSANVDSPEVIRRFRAKLVDFDETCREALDGIRVDVNRVLQWLRREQVGEWKRQLRKREELVEGARRRYFKALQDAAEAGKRGAVDEKKELERAERLKAEAEEKIRSVKRWAMVIEDRSAKMLRPCAALSGLLNSLTPKALERLDTMLDSLDDYMRSAAGAAE
ncbi:MAG: hypothetical protein ACYTGB_07665 [Planctomycetota bacterium]